MPVFWFAVVALLVVLAIALLPGWPYMRRSGWGWHPHLGAAVIAVAIVMLASLGVLTVWLPWEEPVVEAPAAN